MKIGKLTNDQLRRIVLSKLNQKHDVLLSAGVGEDCAALDFGGEACVMSTDPITGASANIGRLAVHISANDVASSGARPIAMLVTMLIPPGCTLNDIEHVCSEMAEEADALDIDIIGGHTEVTDAVNRIVISSTVFGRIASDKLVRSGGAQPGDDIVMTKDAAIEGTYIIACEHEGRLSGLLSGEELDAARQMGDMLSVLQDGIIGAQCGATAMHDVTEGGIFGAVYEMCDASGCGCCLYQDDIPVCDVTRKICDAMGINVYRLIGSGSMVITTPDSAQMIEVLSKSGIKGSVIGRITAEGRHVLFGGQSCDLAPPEKDELFSV